MRTMRGERYPRERRIRRGAFRAPARVLLALAVACSSGEGAGERSALALTSPAADGAANEEHPVLRWVGLPEAERYRVSVHAGPGETELLARQESTLPELRLERALRDGQEAHVVVEAFDAAGGRIGTGRSRFRVVLVPPWFPRFEVVVDERPVADDGVFLLDVAGYVPSPLPLRDSAFALVSRQGEILWWRDPGPGLVNEVQALDDGHLLYWEAPVGRLPRMVKTTWEGAIRWETPPEVIPHHEIIVGPGGHYLYLAFRSWEVDGELLAGDALELVDPATGELRWTWEIIDHVSTDERNEFDLRFGETLLGLDWTHSNGIAWDPDRSLIWLSVRNLDRMLGIDYPSGEVRVTVGDGGLAPGIVSHAHAPELQADGSVLYFDNGNTRDPPISRIAAFRWDEATDTVTETFSWSPDPPFFDLAFGDADRLPNGNVLVLSGTPGVFAPKPPTLYEITEQGEVLWSLVTRPPPWRLLSHYQVQYLDRRSIPSGVLPFDRANLDDAEFADGADPDRVSWGLPRSP